MAANETGAPRLGTVQETLLIPLYGRAVETRDPQGLLDDPRAVEMVDAIDYDFARFDGKGSLVGACLRTLHFDHWVRRFLDDHPAGTVVEIGTGLNTRFERVDNGEASWVELDLPDAIALRRRFFPEDGERRTTVAASVLDTAWLDTVAELPGPYFFAAEAVLFFLAEHEVREVVTRLRARFPGSWLATETVTPAMVGDQDHHDVMSLMKARMRWGCESPAELERWAPGIRLLDSRTLADLPEPVAARIAPARREQIRHLAEAAGEQLAAFPLNLFRLGE